MNEYQDCQPHVATQFILTVGRGDQCLPLAYITVFYVLLPVYAGKYEPISSRYLSQELVGLVRQLLTPDSDVRPSLKHILGLRFV